MRPHHGARRREPGGWGFPTGGGGQASRPTATGPPYGEGLQRERASREGGDPPRAVAAKQRALPQRDRMERGRQRERTSREARRPSIAPDRNGTTVWRGGGWSAARVGSLYGTDAVKRRAFRHFAGCGDGRRLIQGYDGRNVRNIDAGRKGKCRRGEVVRNTEIACGHGAFAGDCFFGGERRGGKRLSLFVERNIKSGLFPRHYVLGNIGENRFAEIGQERAGEIEKGAEAILFQQNGKRCLSRLQLSKLR